MNSAIALSNNGIEPLWLNETLITAIHQRQLSEHGGQDGVRDAALLQSALARPQQIFAYDEAGATLTALAAAYAAGIARNHAFIDGNKRTALVACIMFLRLNGYDIRADYAACYQTFYNLAAGKLSEAELTAWLNARLIELKR